MRLQTSFNSAAARLHASAHSSDVAAAFTRNCRRPDQYGLARAGEVSQMRVKAGPDVARARRHVSTRRPDISGTHPYDLSLLRQCVRCREQHNGTDCNNSLSHRLSPFVLTNYVQYADVQILGMLVDWSAVVGWPRADSPTMLIARSELPPLPVAISVVGLLVIPIAGGRVSISV
jgi:hypothetical protein